MVFLCYEAGNLVECCHVCSRAPGEDNGPGQLSSLSERKGLGKTAHTEILFKVCHGGKMNQSAQIISQSGSVEKVL